METFFGTTSGVVLILWGIIFEAVGAVVMVLCHRAFMRDDRETTRLEEVPSARPAIHEPVSSQSVVHA